MLRTCIACGSKLVERRLIDVKRRSGALVRDVLVDVCATCGERYFDLAAMEKIEAADPPRKARSSRRVRKAT